MIENPVPPSRGKSYQTLFLVGSPRSGTTWLQLLLDQNANIATAPETQIFAYYLDHFRKQWIEEHEGPAAEGQGGSGLSRLLSEEEFLGLCGQTARYVLDKIHDGRPKATWVVEKSPRHAVLVEWILKIFPNAWILHIIRDPRDTAASIIRSGRSWGQSWAPKNPIQAGRMWYYHVVKGREAAKLTDRYLEVRYEDLRAQPHENLGAILDWMSVPHDNAALAAAVDACDLSRLRSNQGEGKPMPSERPPSGFFGKGAVGGWSETLGRSGARMVEKVCFPLMEELGYSPVIVKNGKPLLRIGIHDAVRRVRDSIHWQLTRLLARL